MLRLLGRILLGHLQLAAGILLAFLSPWVFLASAIRRIGRRP